MSMVAATGTSNTVVWCRSIPFRFHGTGVFRFEGLGTSKYSIVTASITELGPDLAPDGPVDLPFVGAAAMSILNVSSGGDGVVYVNINVNYPTDVWVQVSLMIINPST